MPKSPSMMDWFVFRMVLVIGSQLCRVSEMYIHANIARIVSCITNHIGYIYEGHSANKGV